MDTPEKRETPAGEAGAERAPDPVPAHRNHEQAIRLARRPDGAWEAADSQSQALEHQRGLDHEGLVVLGYLYVPRDPDQWHRAHRLADYLVANVEAYTGMSSHKALKELQKKSGAACDVQRIEIGPERIPATITVPRSMAFGWMDGAEFTEAYRTMCQYVRDAYFPDLEGEVTEAMERLMLKERRA